MVSDCSLMVLACVEIVASWRATIAFKASTSSGRCVS